MFTVVPRVLVIADVIPRPAIESPGAHAADVIGHESVTELVAFVYAHPQVVSPGTKLDADCVANSPGKYLLPRAVRIELEDARAIRLAGVVGGVRGGTDRHVHLLPVRREGEVARPMSAAVQQTTGGKLGAQLPRRAARLGVAIPIWESDDAVRVRNIEILRLRPDRIERETECLVQSMVSEDFGDVWF